MFFQTQFKYEEHLPHRTQINKEKNQRWNLQSEECKRRYRMKEKLKKKKKEKKILQLGGPRKVCLEWWVGEPMWANPERRRFGRNWMLAAMMITMMLLPLPSFPNPSYDFFFLSLLFMFNDITITIILCLCHFDSKFLQKELLIFHF